MSKCCEQPRGFTLVEILVCLVIMGIASAVLIPQLGTRGDVVASAAARQVMSDISYAQNQAITSQTPVYVRFVPAVAGAATGGSYSVCTALPSTLLTHPVEKAPWAVSFGGRGPWQTVRVETANFDGKAGLMFDETGAPFSIPANGGVPAPLTAGSVRVACGVFGLTVMIEPLTGGLTVQ